MRHGVVTGSFEDAVTNAVTNLWHGVRVNRACGTAFTAWHGEWYGVCPGVSRCGTGMAR